MVVPKAGAAGAAAAASGAKPAAKSSSPKPAGKAPVQAPGKVSAKAPTKAPAKVASKAPAKQKPAADYELAGEKDALSLALDLESHKPKAGEMQFDEPAQPRVTLASDIVAPAEERRKGPGLSIFLNVPWWSIIGWGVVLSLPIMVGVIWMNTLGLNFKVAAVEPVSAYPALATLARSRPVGLNLSAVDPDKPGQAIKTPFSHWGLSGKLDSRNTVGGSDVLVLVKPDVPSPTHVIVRIIVSQGFLDDHNIGGSTDLRLNVAHWELQGNDGYKANPVLLRWRMANPAVINISSSSSIDPAVLLPLNCQPTEAKHNRRELLDLPDSGTMTFAGEGCTGKIDYHILKPMGMASAAGFSANGDLKVETPAGFPMDLTYNGGVLGIRWPTDRQAWWGTDGYIKKTGSFEQTKHELIMLFELPEKVSGEYAIVVQGDSVGSINPLKAHGSVQPEGVSERNAELTAR